MSTAYFESPSSWISRLLASSLPVLFLALVFLTAPAAIASGPTAGLATVELIDHTPTSTKSPTPSLDVALSSFAEDGGSLEHLLTTRFAGGGFVPNPFGGISYSPDGSRIAFTAEAEAEAEGTVRSMPWPPRNAYVGAPHPCEKHVTHRVGLGAAIRRLRREGPGSPARSPPAFRLPRCPQRPTSGS